VPKTGKTFQTIFSVDPPTHKSLLFLNFVVWDLLDIIHSPDGIFFGGKVYLLRHPYNTLIFPFLGSFIHLKALNSRLGPKKSCASSEAANAEVLRYTLPETSLQSAHFL